MLSADLVRASAQATLAMLLISGNAELWHFVAIAFVPSGADAQRKLDLRTGAFGRALCAISPFAC